MRCPYCQGTNLEVEVLHCATGAALFQVALDKTDEVRLGVFNPSRVICLGCGAAGPKGDGPSAAILVAATIMGSNEEVTP